MNNVNLIGRLVKNPELKQTAGGIPVTSFTLAVRRTGSSGITDWIPCIAWRNEAEFLCKYFEKGMPLAVTGSIQTREREKDGTKFKDIEVHIDEVEFVPRSKAKEGEAEETKPQEKARFEPKEIYSVNQSFSQGSDGDFLPVDTEDLPF